MLICAMVSVLASFAGVNNGISLALAGVAELPGEMRIPAVSSVAARMLYAYHVEIGILFIEASLLVVLWTLRPKRERIPEVAAAVRATSLERDCCRTERSPMPVLTRLWKAEHRPVVAQQRELATIDR
jgi:hypothetical protein